MKFKVGDYVKIKEGLNEGTTNNFIKEMEEYCGKEAKIVEITKPYYKLDIDNKAWFWGDDMFESTQKKTYNVIVDGNTVTVTDDEGNTGVAKCSPEDEFDLSTGISLAVDRLKWKPKKHERYWTTNFSNPDYVMDYVWVDDSTDRELFNNGVIFKTEKEAKEVAKKMLEVVK